ncbi:hypothetical protein SGCOL_001640 [Colletotrichum sp. CLE4]
MSLRPDGQLHPLQRTQDLLVPAYVGSQIQHDGFLLRTGQWTSQQRPPAHDKALLRVGSSSEHDFEPGVDLPDLLVRAGPAVHGVGGLAQADSAPPEGSAPVLGLALAGHDCLGVELAG